jgi:hypothetical protein
MARGFHSISSSVSMLPVLLLSLLSIRWSACDDRRFLCTS